MKMIRCISFYNNIFLLIFTYIIHNNTTIMLSHNFFVFVVLIIWGYP